jgi:hypothetical protein
MVGSFIPFVYLSPHQNMEIASEWSVNHYLLLDLRLWFHEENMLGEWVILLSHCLLFDAAGSINISNILTGKCLAKINATSGRPKVDQSSSSTACSSKQQDHSRVRSTVAEALEDITALFYDEERNEIYTGNRHGLVHVWSNWKMKIRLQPEDWLFILSSHVAYIHGITSVHSYRFPYEAFKVILHCIIWSSVQFLCTKYFCRSAFG